MVPWEEMALVGRVARTHGLRGQVIVNPETDSPETRFRVGAVLFLQGPDGPRGIRVLSMRSHRGRPIIALDGIETIGEAAGLAGVELRIPDAELNPLDAGSYYRHDLLGCEVTTDRGDTVGRVKAVDGPNASSYLVVDDGTDEVLIPLAEAICREVDVASRRIVISPPEGLLELNARRGNVRDFRLR